MYSTFPPFENDSLHVNGELTLGENIADLGGMIISYNALQKALAGKRHTHQWLYSVATFLPKLCHYLENKHDRKLCMQILSNEHSPAKFRVNGVLSNLPEFYKAFNVKPTDKMYISKKKTEKKCGNILLIKKTLLF